MTEIKHPFKDSGNGCPTSESVRTALGMFSLGSLADTSVNFRGQAGPMVELITHCKIEQLVTNWPKDFIAQVIGAASQASQPRPEG
jgi:hypothetical protein